MASKYKASIYKSVQIVLHICLILVSLYFFNFEQAKPPDFYLFLKSNWLKDPVLDIKPAQSGSCDSIGEPLYNYLFPGTYEACKCNIQITTRECSPQEIASGCQTIRDIPAYVLEKWTIEGSSYHLCVQRLKGYNYFQAHKKY